MRNLFFIIILFISFGCDHGTQNAKDSSNDVNVVKEFLQNVKSLESVENSNPIALFREEAENIASDIETFSKDNLEELFTKARKFKHCVITVGDHTIIMIKDFEDCTQSGSWSACMPLVEGYIKKGDLLFQEDYMNNIIGIPDSQERTAYLFN